MKYFIITIILITSTISVFSSEEVFNKIDDLISKNKFKTAYDYLISNSDKIEENNLLKKKTELCINNFVNSMSHEMFSFIDIPEGHDIYDYRGKDGSYESFVFRVEEEYSNMLKKYPNDPELYYWLAQYYYDILLRYSGRWLKSDQEVIDLAIKNYNLSIDKGFSNEFLYGNLGYMYLRKGVFDKSEICYKKSLILVPDNASNAYNLSISLYRQKKYRDAQEFIKIAIDNYKDNYYKADSYYLAGDIETNLDNLDKAVEYYENAKKLNPQNYLYYQRLILVYLASNNADLANKNSIIFFNMYPTNPNAIQYIIEQYNVYGKLENALTIIEELIIEYKLNYEALGNLYFHKALVNDGLYNTEASLEDLISAEKIFIKVFPEEHEVFNEIKRLRDEFTSN